MKATDIISDFVTRMETVKQIRQQRPPSYQLLSANFMIEDLRNDLNDVLITIHRLALYLAEKESEGEVK